MTFSSLNNWGPKPFKCFDWWLKNEDLISELKYYWDLTDSMHIYHKLRSARQVIGNWHIKEGALEEKIKLLEDVQEKADVENCCEVEKAKYKLELERLYDARASELEQKTR